MNFDRHKSFLIGNYALPSIEIVRGKGTRLWDSHGKQYLDFACGIAVTNLGHSHPTWVSKLQEQTEKLVHCSNIFSIPQQVDLAEDRGLQNEENHHCRGKDENELARRLQVSKTKW